MGNRFVILAAGSGFIAVAFGAFAAHALQNQFSEQQLNWFGKAWQYQVFHTLALLVLGFFISATTQQSQNKYQKNALNIIGISWIIGILCFCFSLYVMALLNSKALAMIVPVGGVAFLVGWATLFWVSVRSSLKNRLF